MPPAGCAGGTLRFSAAGSPFPNAPGFAAGLPSERRAGRSLDIRARRPHEDGRSFGAEKPCD